MNKKNKTTFMKFIVRFFFSLSVFVCVVGTENYLPALTEYSYYQSQTEIELVVPATSDNDLGLFKLTDTSKLTTKTTQPDLCFLSNQKLALLHYNNTIRHQIISFLHAFTPNQHLLSILHKTSVWHQSPDEVPFLFG